MGQLKTLCRNEQAWVDQDMNIICEGDVDGPALIVNYYSSVYNDMINIDEKKIP